MGNQTKLNDQLRQIIKSYASERANKDFDWIKMSMIQKAQDYGDEHISLKLDRDLSSARSERDFNELQIMLKKHGLKFEIKGNEMIVEINWE